MTDPKTCPKCGASLAADAPEGACPRCLLAAGLESGAPGAAPGDAPAASSAPSPADMQKHFPGLEVQELLGQGGMGIVYKARQKNLDRSVALKILLPEIAREAGFADRFTREARTLARLHHQHIVGVHDFGESDGLWYLLMEYVDGTNLRQLMRAGGLGPKEALAIVPQVCDALQYAHDQGIVHRDIKPENILVDKTGRVKIADFGLAKLLQRAPVELNITRTGQVMGTLHYMAPEQYRAPEGVDHRADIYSLGVVFYEMLTGDLPVGSFPRPSERAGVDVRLDGVVLRALERERDQRYQKASEVRTAVDGITAAPAAAPTAVAAAPVAEAAPAAAVPPAPPPVEGRLSRMAVAGALAFPAAALLGLVVSGMVSIVADSPVSYAAGAWTLILAILVGWGLSITAWARIHHSGGRLVGKAWAVVGTIVNPILICCPGWTMVGAKNPSRFPGASRIPFPGISIEDGPGGTRVRVPGVEINDGPDGTRVKVPGIEINEEKPNVPLGGYSPYVPGSEFENAPDSMDAERRAAIIRELAEAWDEVVRMTSRPGENGCRALLVKRDRDAVERLTATVKSREMVGLRLGASYLPMVAGSFAGSDPAELRITRVVLSADGTRVRVLRSDGKLVLSYLAEEEGRHWRFVLAPVERTFVRGGPATAEWQWRWRADAVRGLEMLWAGSGADLLREHFPGTDLADRASLFRIHALALRPNSTSGRMVWTDGGVTISLPCRYVAGKWDIPRKSVQRLDRAPEIEDRDGWLGKEPEPADATEAPVPPVAPEKPAGPDGK